jgi:hypothetical protein
MMRKNDNEVDKLFKTEVKFVTQILSMATEFKGHRK